MSTLMVTRAVYDAFRTHGEEAYPHECCGALLGQPDAKGWRVMESIRAGNLRGRIRRTTRYHIAPIELVRIQRVARGQRAEDCRGSITPIHRPSGAMVYNRFC